MPIQCLQVPSLYRGQFLSFNILAPKYVCEIIVVVGRFYYTHNNSKIITFRKEFYKKRTMFSKLLITILFYFISRSHGQQKCRRFPYLKCGPKLSCCKSRNLICTRKGRCKKCKQSFKNLITDVRCTISNYNSTLTSHFFSSRCM